MSRRNRIAYSLLLLAAALALSGCEWVVMNPSGDVARQQADLIIIASHKPGFQDYFLGSTAAKVVRHAPCSVLVVR